MARNFNSDKEQNLINLNSGIDFISVNSNLGIPNSSCIQEYSYDSFNNLTGVHTWENALKNNLLYKKTLRYDGSNNLTGILINKNISDVFNLKVTASNGAFFSDCEEKKNIYLKLGDTVIFDQFESSNLNHTLKISNTNDGSHNGGDTLISISGADYSGTPGSNGTTSFKAPLAGTYYYYCAAHPGMGGSINVSNFDPFPIVYTEHNTYSAGKISESIKIRNA